MSITNQSGIYAITNSVNGKMYVGSAVNFARRWARHRWLLGKNAHHSVVLQNAWNKHGADAFVFDVVEFVDPSRLIEREQVWLDFFKPQYNVARVAGSALGVKRTEETCAKQRAASVGRSLPEWAIAKAHSANTGRRLTPEHRARISAALEGRPPSAEALVKARAARTGSKHTEETRNKISIALTGRTASPETRAKMSASLRGRFERKRLARLLTGDGAPSQNQSHAEYRHRDGTPASAGYEAERGE